MTVAVQPVHAVLFDLDGTLVDTDIDFPLMKNRLLALAASHGLNTEPLKHLDILAMIDVAENSLQDNPDSAANLRLRAMNILQDIELKHARNTREVPYARELLDKLRARGFKVGIVTRNCRAASLISLRMVGIHPDALVCREDTALRKPHPHHVLRAMEELKCAKEHSWMVGDHIMDIESGRAAGVKTVGFLRDYRPRDFFDVVAPDAVVTNLQEVLGVVVDCCR